MRVSLGGKVVDRVPDADGRILLERSQREAQASDAITVRVSRLIDDGIPLHVTTHGMPGGQTISVLHTPAWVQSISHVPAVQAVHTTGHASASIEASMVDASMVEASTTSTPTHQPS